MDRPAEIPWDIFGVDAVIEATGRFSEAGYMRDHLANGAKRVVLRTLPKDDIDRIVVPGVNGQSISCEDRMISAGSATTSALVLLLHTLSAKFEISCASMTTIHAYTSDQALQDYAGSDFRRSRSAAENIIPNSHEAATWLGHILPNFADKVLTAALNVPIQKGCLLDVNLVMADSAVTVEDINQVMRDSVADYRNIIDVVEDPIVSSDVIGNPHSLLFDTKGTIKAGAHTIKALAWYETLGHAARLLDVVRLYQHVDASREVA
jgi:glyceraldehyde 3-phosphate dehydrogenase